MVAGHLRDEDECFLKQRLISRLEVDSTHGNHFDSQEVDQLRGHMTGFTDDALCVSDVFVELFLKQAIDEHKPVKTTRLDFFHEADGTLAQTSCLFVGVDQGVHALDKLGNEPLFKALFEL